jgi:hypothetical protein
VIATKVIAIKTGSACIAVGAVTVVAVVSVRIGPTIAAVTSKALPRNPAQDEGGGDEPRQPE